MVPKTMRKKVMEVAHDSIFGEQLGIKKTKTSAGLSCKVMLLVSADHVMYVRRRLLKDPFPMCH